MVVYEPDVEIFGFVVFLICPTSRHVVVQEFFHSSNSFFINVLISSSDAKDKGVWLSFVLASS